MVPKLKTLEMALMVLIAFVASVEPSLSLSLSSASVTIFGHPNRNPGQTCLPDHLIMKQIGQR